jgi:hypothetical protein
VRNAKPSKRLDTIQVAVTEVLVVVVLGMTNVTMIVLVDDKALRKTCTRIGRVREIQDLLTVILDHAKEIEILIRKTDVHHVATIVPIPVMKQGLDTDPIVMVGTKRTVNGEQNADDTVPIVHAVAETVDVEIVNVGTADAVQAGDTADISVAIVLIGIALHHIPDQMEDDTSLVVEKS